MDKPDIWGTPEEELRAIAKDCVDMGRPDLAVAAQRLAEEERERAALTALYGSLFTSRR